jgi:hypothetical protein
VTQRAKPEENASVPEAKRKYWSLTGDFVRPELVVKSTEKTHKSVFLLTTYPH